MKTYASNDEILVDAKNLVDRWCDERKLRALARLLPGYLSLNGLTDDWAILCEALKSTRALGRDAFSPRDWETLSDLIHAAEGTVYRR